MEDEYDINKPDGNGMDAMDNSPLQADDLPDAAADEPIALKMEEDTPAAAQASTTPHVRFAPSVATTPSDNAFLSPVGLYPFREWQCQLPRMKDPIRLNPVVTLISVVGLWSLVIWSSGACVRKYFQKLKRCQKIQSDLRLDMRTRVAHACFEYLCFTFGIPTPVDREGAVNKLGWWRSQVSFTCNWLFQGTKTFFFFFLMYITYRYGHLHLAPNAEIRPGMLNLALLRCTC
jgi:hypothetical protein